MRLVSKAKINNGSVLFLIMDSSEKKIIKAAAMTFINQGYFGATTRNIANAAGVNEITLFRKFKSKNNLLNAVMKREEEIIDQMMNRLLFDECDLDVKTCLRNLIQKMCNLPVEIDIFVMLYDARLVVPQIKEHISDMLQMMVRLISQYLKEQIKKGKITSIDPDAMAWIFVGYLAANTLLVGYAPDELVINHRGKGIDDFIEFFMKGIIKPEKH